ncbi:MAG: metallophosphoesterase family protein [Lentisphaeria bacterium]|nr:metallophosphoesterase family protein [Lentisphaeria bacterium]
MAKIAIMSDIHSNTEALAAVLQKCSDLGIEQFVLLGDIVGYNAEPVQCIQAVKSLNVIGRVRGNHDEYAGNAEKGIEGFNENAQRAVLWTAEQLSDEDKKYLMEAPYRLNLPKYGMTLVHATLDSPGNWGYIFDSHHAQDNFNYQYTQVGFCGHSHYPIAFEKKNVIFGGKNIEELVEWRSISLPDTANFDEESSVTVDIKPDRKYLFNVGSIGQPRNRDPRSSFAVYDPEGGKVTRYCIPYDIAGAQEKILLAGLPQRLAERLANGS